jgi:dephospho-CoA kinase
MIIVVVGLPGSGKSTAAQLLKEEGFQVIELGDIWRGLLREYKIPRDDPKATREFTLWVRKKEGKDIYAKRAVKLIKKSMSNIVIMGVRSTYEMDYLKRRIKEMKVIAIVSPFKTRFNRLKVRSKPEDPKTIEDFRWLETRERRGFMSDKKEEKHGVMVLIKSADYVISNTSSVGELESDLKGVLEKIGKKR